MIAAAPGSLPWLIAHEIRLFWRQRAGRGKRARWIGLGLLAAMMVVIGVAIGRNAPGRVTDPVLLSVIDVLVLFVGLLMTSQGIVLSIKTLYERGDLELLLPAPIDPRRILAAKMAGVASAVATAFLPLIALIAVPLALLGGIRWLGLVVVVVALAFLAAAVAALVAMALFAVLGPRRARVAAQVVAALVGAGFFIGAQALRFVPPRWLEMAGAIGIFHHLLSRAATGDVPSLLMFAAVAAIAFATVAAALGGRFVRDAARAPGAIRRRRAATASFSSSVAGAVLAKELRLLGREPELLFPIVLRAFYIMPVMAPFAFEGTGVSPALAASALTLFSAQLCGSLAWVTLCAEDAPDLLAASPAAAITVRRTKLLAAVLPIFALAIVPALLIATAAPLAAAAALAGAGAGGLSAALLQYWYGRPQRRDAFKAHRNASILLGLADIALSLLWSWAAGLAAGGSPWAAAPAIVAVAALFADTERKRR